MKLALAIAVCVYLCAVIAVGQGKSDVGDLEFQRILAFVSGDPKYKVFPQTATDDQLYKDYVKKVNADPLYQAFPQTINDNRLFKAFLKNDDGYERFSDYIHALHQNKRINVGTWNQASKYICSDKMYFNAMCNSYETFESNNGINWGVSDEDWVKIKAYHHLYKMFLEDVDNKYTRFLENAIDPPFEEELIKVDLDFKLKCILAFRNAGDSSSSTRTTCCWISNIAYDILEEKLGILGDLEFQRILAFVNGDPKYRAFPQTVNSDRLYKAFLENKQKYEQMGKNDNGFDLSGWKRALPSFHSNVNSHPLYEALLQNEEGFKDKQKYEQMDKNDDDGHQKCLDFFDFLHDTSSDVYEERRAKIKAKHSTIRSFYSDKLKYMIMRRKYERREGDDLYKIFLEDVHVEYTRFLVSAENPKPTHSFRELNKADLDFKLKCILAFRTVGDSSSSTRTTCVGISNIANDILKEQLGIFIKDLKDSVFDKDAKAKLKNISKKKKDFLGFFGLWFATDWEKYDMKTKIRNMKQEHRLGNNDKAAKIMVLLEIFDEGKK